MDRIIVYPGAIPQDTDILHPQRNAMTAIGWFLQSVMGTTPGVAGLACTPTSPASMIVNVGPGALWGLSNIDANAFGSLAADTSPLMKMGILPEAAGTNFTLTAPTTSGQSIAYLLQAAVLESDTVPVVLPYVNPANPAQPYSGPANNGVAQNTVRAQTIELQLKAGVAANTGTQTTPAVDTGYQGIYVITVAYGQTTVTASNIARYPNAPFLPFTLPQLAAAQAAAGAYAALNGSATEAFAVAASNNASDAIPLSQLQSQFAQLSQFPSSLGVTGYKKYPDPNTPTGEIIEQYGQSSTNSAGYVTVTLPIAFPNAIFGPIATINNVANANSISADVIGIGANPSTTSFNVFTNNQSGAVGPIGFNWVVKGY